MSSEMSPAPVQAQTFAFITHSPATLPNNLPPEVDDASLARKRRRRTSQKDQVVLEEEFAKCDRPGREKRIEIAKLVGLQEKQVQIWFQNRRQTHRRKSKPLQPHERIPRHPQPSSDTIVSPLNTKNTHEDDTIELPSPSSRASSPCPQVDLPNHLSDATEPDLSTLTADTSVSSIESFNESEIVRKTSPIHFLLNPSADTPDTSFESTQSTIPDEPEISQLNTTMIKSIPSEVTQTFVNPRRSGFMAQPQPTLLKRSSSAIRLSMSFDGKATIVLEDDDEVPRGSQTSTQSASFNEHTPPKRRTENAKIWESCCDTSAVAEPVKEDSPRKALKTIRARGVVAAAKAAAESRKQKAVTGSSEVVKTKKRKAKILSDKSTNPTLDLANTPTKRVCEASNKPLKIQQFSPTSNKTRKVITSTQKGPKKATPSPPMSAVKKTRSPFRTLSETLNGKNNNKPGFTIYQSSDEGDSDKENWEPGSKIRKNRDAQQPAWRDNKGPRNVLTDLENLGERIPPPNELEVIENLMSLRDGLWR